MGGSSSTMKKSGLDSFEYINDSITSILYQPPKTNHKKIASLNERPNTSLITVGSTSICEIIPNTIIHDNIVIIFSHGNGCDIFTMYNYCLDLANKLGIIVVCYDYPSYGLSTGVPNEESCVNSLSNVVSNYRNKKILLIGNSLGTCVTCSFVGSRLEWKYPIILISPCKSIPRVLYDSSLVESCVSKNKYPNHFNINYTSCSIKIFHGINDDVIPFEHSVNLYNTLQNKMFKPTFFNGCGHDDILEKITKRDYEKVIEKFYDDIN